MSTPQGRIAAINAAAFVTIATYLSYGVSLIVGAIVARALGPDAYGRYAYVVWLTGFLVMLANHGLPISAIRFVAECLGADQPRAAAAVHSWLLRLQLLSLTLVLAAYAVWVINFPPTGWQGQVRTLLILGVVCAAAKTRYLFDVSVGKGHSDFSIEPTTTIASSLLSAAATLILVARGANVTSFLTLFAVISVGLAVSAAWLLRRSGARAHAAPLQPALKQSLRQHLFWTTLMTVGVALASRSVETYLLAIHYGPASVGFFSIASGLTRGSIELLTTGLTAILMPTLARAQGSNDPAQVQRIFGDTFRFLVFLGLLLAGGGAFWSGPVVHLFYGAKFEPAILVLRIMMIVWGLTLFDATTSAVLAITGRQHQRAALIGAATALSFIFGILLVPRFGLTGAVISASLVRLSFSIPSVIQALAAIRGTLPYTALGRLFAAAAAAALIALASYLLPLGVYCGLLAGVIFGMGLVLLSIRLRAWTRHDVALALELARRLPRALGWVRGLIQRWHNDYTH